MYYSFPFWGKVGMGARSAIRLLLRPDEVSISVRAELVEASAALRQAQGERFIHHGDGSISYI